jgi:hypothetical protein
MGADRLICLVPLSFNTGRAYEGAAACISLRTPFEVEGFRENTFLGVAQIPSFDDARGGRTLYTDST